MTTKTYYIVRYDTPNGRPTKKFIEDDEYLISAESRAFSFYTHKKDNQANPELIEVTERKVR